MLAVCSVKKVVVLGYIYVDKKVFIPAIPTSIMEILRRTGKVYTVNVGCLCIDKKVFIPATRPVSWKSSGEHIQCTLSMLVVPVWMRSLFLPHLPVSWKSSEEQVACTLNVGCLCLGNKAFIPATPSGIMEILRRTGTVYTQWWLLLFGWEGVYYRHTRWYRRNPQENRYSIHAQCWLFGWEGIYSCLIRRSHGNPMENRYSMHSQCWLCLFGWEGIYFCHIRRYHENPLCGWEAIWLSLCRKVGVYPATHPGILEILRRTEQVQYTLNVAYLCVDKKVFIPATPAGITEILCVDEKAFIPNTPSGIMEILRRTGTVCTLNVGCLWMRRHLFLPHLLVSWKSPGEQVQYTLPMLAVCV